MNCRLLWVTTVFAIINRTIANNGVRSKRGNEDVFNVLLNLYKMQPLKSSKVYRIFADKILLPYHMDDSTSNINSNESTKEKHLNPKLSLREIEQLIQTNNTSFPRKMDKPNYDVENVGSEKFNVDIVFNDAMRLNAEKTHPHTEKPIIIEDDNNFSAILGRIESIETHTQLLPIVDAINDNTTPDAKINEVAPIYYNQQLENNYIPTNDNVDLNGMNYYDNAGVIVI